jgi:hypothetical protein
MDFDKETKDLILKNIPSVLPKRYPRKERTEREKYNSLSLRKKIEIKQKNRQK